MSLARIAYVVDTFDRGGAERCVAHLVNLLPESDYESVVVCLSRNGSAAEWIERPGVQVVELNKSHGNDVRVLHRLAQTLRRHRIELVQSHNWGTLVETAIARRLAGVRRHVHVEQGTVLGDLDLPARKRLLRGTVAGWTLRSASATVAVAEATRRTLAKLTGYPARRVELITNGVTIPAVGERGNETRKKLRESLGIQDATIVVGSVGRLVAVKGFEQGIAAIGQLASRGAPVALLLVGDGPERTNLEALVRANGLQSHVHFAGEQSDVGGWLSTMEIYVNCSHSEGTSLSIMEAMACGLPFVVTDVGDNAMLVANGSICGSVVPARDPEALAREIGHLAENPEVRRRFGWEAQRRHEAFFSAEATTRKYEQLYNKLLSRR